MVDTDEEIDQRLFRDLSSEDGYNYFTIYQGESLDDVGFYEIYYKVELIPNELS